MNHPRLRVIIVNFNVRYFLEQALRSVRRAAQLVDCEVFVVDNASSDDSCEFVRTNFPEVNLIENTVNVGFSKANNQAIRDAQTDYILLLNPDTLVEEDTFKKCLDFMDARPEAGGLGVKMMDGTGQFLPESKRGFPSPWVAFCKTFGLASLFPRSKTFNEYHLGYLSPDENHEIDILSGAFMLLRKRAIDQVGLLDEAFFMYGEDIDLSWRLRLGGWTNWYVADTQIIHYKGESTKKGSLNYVRVFYQAMLIFARKHFTGGTANAYVIGLEMAIWLRAGLTIASNLWKKIRLPLADAALIFGGLIFLKDFWARAWFDDPDHFAPVFLRFSAPFYLAMWLGAVFFSGGYDEKYSLRRLLRGLAVGTLGILAIYGLLETELRSSRILIILGSVWAAVSMVGLRAMLHFLEFKNLRIGQAAAKKMVIVGSKTEAERAKNLLAEAGVSKNLIGFIAPLPGPDTSGEDDLGSLENLAEIVRIYRVNEVIFCSKDVAAQTIIGWMTRLGSAAIEVKILPEESGSIIGSHSKNTPGELYTIEVRFAIAEPLARRNKLIFDWLVGLFCLVFSPVLLFFGNGRRMLAMLPAVFFLQKTWVGYAKTGDSTSRLPKLKPPIFNPADGLGLQNPTVATIERLNFLFAKDWSVWRDLEIVGRSFFAKS